MTKLSQIETDLITELFNLGIGRAGKSLSMLAKQPIETSVPHVTVQSQELFSQELLTTPMMCCVSQEVRGIFNTNSMLFFPMEESYEIVRLMLNQDFPREMLIALHEDAVTEIGNIIINACIGTISNYLKTTFEIDIPMVTTGTPHELLSKALSDGIILHVGIDLKLKQSNIDGYLLFAFGPLSLRQLKRTLQQTLKKIHPVLAENS